MFILFRFVISYHFQRSKTGHKSKSGFWRFYLFEQIFSIFVQAIQLHVKSYESPCREQNWISCLVGKSCAMELCSCTSSVTAHHYFVTEGCAEHLAELSLFCWHSRILPPSAEMPSQRRDSPPVPPRHLPALVPCTARLKSQVKIPVVVSASKMVFGTQKQREVPRAVCSICTFMYR